jgi:hypothetical protein
MEENRNVFKLLVGKPEGKRPLRQMDLGEMGWDGVDWVGLAQDRTGGELL